MVLFVLASCGNEEASSGNGKETAENVNGGVSDTEKSTEEGDGTEENSGEVTPEAKPEKKLPSFELGVCGCKDSVDEKPNNKKIEYKVTFGDRNDIYEVSLCKVMVCEDNCSDIELLLKAASVEGGEYSAEFLYSLGESDGMPGITKVYKYSMTESMLEEYPDGEADERISHIFRSTMYMLPLGDARFLFVKISPTKDAEVIQGERALMDSLVKGIMLENSIGEALTPVKECTHRYAEKVIVDAGCTIDGCVLRRCEICKDEKTEILLATGHSPSAATCTEASVCTICTEALAPAKGHDFIPATTDAPKTCRVCGHTEGEALPKVTLNTSAAIGTFEHSGYAAGNTEALYSYRIDGVRYEIGTQQSDGKYPIAIYFTGEWLFDNRPDRVSPGNNNKHINELLWYQLYREGLCSMSKSILIEEYKHSQKFEATVVVYLYSGEYELRANPGIYICRDPLYGGSTL